MTVIDFPKQAKDYVFQCQCGCQTFFLYQSSEVQCASCEEFVYDDGVWAETRPERTEENTVKGQVHSKVVLLENPETTLKRVLKNVNAEDTVAVAVLQRDGVVRSWSNFDYLNEERKAWLKSQLDEAYGLLVK
jgi:hypothetical protein